MPIQRQLRLPTHVHTHGHTHMHTDILATAMWPMPCGRRFCYGVAQAGRMDKIWIGALSVAFMATTIYSEHSEESWMRVGGSSLVAYLEP